MESFAPLIAAGGLVSLLLGLSLIAPLDRSYRIERVLYRHHRLTGLVLTGLACVLLWQLAPGKIIERALAALVDYFGQLSERGELMLLINALVACCIFTFGLVIALRPSALKPLEAYLNRETALAWGRDAFDFIGWSRQLSLARRFLLGILVMILGALLITVSLRWLLP